MTEQQTPKPKRTRKLKEETGVAIRQDSGVEALISQGITANLDVEKMKQLFELRQQVKAEQAREAYVESLSRFQEQMPVVEKTKKVMNKDGRTVRYQYAPLDAIAEALRKPLGDNGLSYRWETTNEPTQITVKAIVTHRLGHSESSTFQVPIDSEGYMTAPQKVAAALTFAKRYSLINALGISTGDEDTDATTVNDEKEAQSPKARIVFLLRTLREKNSTRGEIEEAVKRLTQLDLKEENFDEIISRLEILVSEHNEDRSHEN